MRQKGMAADECITQREVSMVMRSEMARPQKPQRDWVADNGEGYTVQANPAMLMRDGWVEAVAIIPPGYLGE